MCFHPDVDACVEVPVVMGTALGAVPFSNRQVLHVFVLITARGAELAGGKVLSHWNHRLTVPGGLVLQHASKFRPSDFRDGFSQTRVLEKTGNRKVLDADDVVFFDNLSRLLLKEVGPDVFDSRVDSGDRPFLLLVVSGLVEFLSIFPGLRPSSGEDPLFFGQLLFKGPEGLQVLQGRRPIRQDRKVCDPEVYAHRGFRLQECVSLDFAKKGDKVFPGSLSCDGGADDPAFHLSALADPHETELREFHPVLHESYALIVVFGRVGLDGITLALKSWALG